MTSHTYIIAELGINHNGSLDLALAMMQQAKACGADAVKFQKRSLHLVYTPEELAQPRPITLSSGMGGPWSGHTNGDWKRRLEFSHVEYDRIYEEATRLELDWSASCWDLESLNFLMRYNPPWIKVPSAVITDQALLHAYRQTETPVWMSTGMSTPDEIHTAVQTLGPEVLFHCHSAYPAPLEETNLACIPWLARQYPAQRIGYSAHTVSPWPALMAACLGASVIEVHLTQDRTMYGTDQAASLEPVAFAKLVKEIRTWEQCRGDGVKRVWASEEPARKKLRRVS